MPRHQGRYAPLLGTSVEVVVDVGYRRSAKRTAEQIVAELQRLENVFNIYSPDTEISRLIAEVDGHFASSPMTGSPVQMDVSEDLAAVLRLATKWHQASDGRFDPMIGGAVDAWRACRQTGVVPQAENLASLVSDGGVPFEVYTKTDKSVLLVAGRLTGLNVNGLAKGWILDQVVESCGPVRSVFVNAGGDVARRGSDELSVRIEDPARPYDNADPLTTVRLLEGGVATSGSSRRPVEIAGQRFSHILDPRSAMPATEVAAASVMAPQTATADVLATILTAGTLAEARATIESGLIDEHRAGVLIVGADGTVVSNRRWDDTRAPSSVV